MGLSDRLRERFGDRLPDRRDGATPGSCGYCGLSFDRSRRNCPACGVTVEDD